MIPGQRGADDENQEQQRDNDPQKDKHDFHSGCFISRAAWARSWSPRTAAARSSGSR
jgi:hypothetical protein